MQRNLTHGCKRTRVVNATAAGTTVINGTAVDMRGFTGLDFLVLLGALTATQVTTVKAQGSVDGVNNWTDLAGTLVGPALDADGNKMLVLSLYRPQFRFVRPVVGRGTANAVIDGVIAEQYLAANEPVTQDATVSDYGVAAYSAAGTP